MLEAEQRRRGLSASCYGDARRSRSAGALGSPQMHFTFRRFGTDPVTLLPTQNSHQGEPTSGVTGPGCGAIDCRDEPDAAEDGGQLLSFRLPSPFQFPVALFQSKVLCLSDMRASLRTKPQLQTG
ncbi:hypothetical protein TREES_T100010987 [Tupaia chinensis]|uniref:Uncharacterized protein n=1 Tax=Tupaia chinensis TaxID=246437 RepID=L9JED0_TUPCH|nr:hypothetical protein TREES_T100010987 [Tupaia chinensis]